MPKILYVEDNDDNLYMLTLRFEALDGYQIVPATDGAAGVAMAAAEQPDLILMDLNLPVIDGRRRLLLGLEHAKTAIQSLLLERVELGCEIGQRILAHGSLRT